jgi:hypothetical protein
LAAAAGDNAGGGFSAGGCVRVGPAVAPDRKHLPPWLIELQRRALRALAEARRAHRLAAGALRRSADLVEGNGRLLAELYGEVARTYNCIAQSREMAGGGTREPTQ